MVLHERGLARSNAPSDAHMPSINTGHTDTRTHAHREREREREKMVPFGSFVMRQP